VRLHKKQEQLEDLRKQDELKLDLFIPEPVWRQCFEKRQGSSMKSKTGSDKGDMAKVKT
jgi:hypothetical protein